MAAHPVEFIIVDPEKVGDFVEDGAVDLLFEGGLTGIFIFERFLVNGDFVGQDHVCKTRCVRCEECLRRGQRGFHCSG